VSPLPRIRITEHHGGSAVVGEGAKQFDLFRDVTLAAGSALWLPAQSHSGENIGTTPTHTILVELKKSSLSGGAGGLGPVTDS